MSDYITSLLFFQFQRVLDPRVYIPSLWQEKGTGAKKRKGSLLNPEEAEECIRKILYLIEIENVYRDVDISLNALAEKLKISPRYISQVINERLKKNFYELINQYRIKEAQKLLISPEGCDKSILEIGYEVGFNSKSAFNRAFKYFTQMTPSQFRKKYKCSDS